MEENRPRVGIGVLVLRGDKVLLGKRKGSHGEGEYAFPGGHLEYMESFEDCARRETMEEAGLEIEHIRFQFVANLTQYAPKHYVHIGITADAPSGTPQVMEPNKKESWDWYDIDALPQPLFAGCKTHIDAYRTGQVYFEAVE